MNPAIFLNRIFQMAALNNYAKMLDGHARIFDDPDDLVAVGEDGIAHEFPEAGQQAWQRALKAEESPDVCFLAGTGWFVTHAFKGDPDDEPMRMVCYAEIGPQAFNQTACDWWKEQGADPDKYAPGVTDLHRQKPEPEPEEPTEKPSREMAVGFIEALSKMNPDGDPHGSIDKQFTQHCKDFTTLAAKRPDRKPDTPLTLEEWKGLTRDSDDMNKPFEREILDAVDPLVFLAVLRDRLVFTSGAAGNIIRMISIVVDPHIDAQSMTWRP